MEKQSHSIQDILLENFKASIYSHFYEKDGYYALYHSLYMNLLYVKKDAFDVFCKIKSGVRTREIINSHKYINKEAVIDTIKLLYENNLIVNSSDKESILNKENLSNISIDIQIMYLILTDKCNLNCKYCFIENAIDNNHLHESMSIDNLKKSVDLFDKLSLDNKENRTIILYGGEPLLNKDTLKKGICYIRESLKDVKINLITNATEISREDAAFFRDYSIDVSISIDGLESINDSARVFLNNKGCFKNIIKGYNNLKLEKVPNIGASITLGSHNIVNLKKNIEQLIKYFDFNSIGFNFLVDFTSVHLKKEIVL